MFLHLSCCGWFNESTGATEEFQSWFLRKPFLKILFQKLLPFLNSIDNRLASLLDPRLKDKWTEDDVQKKEAICLLEMHVTSRLGQCEEDSSSTSTSTDETKSLPKSQGYLALSQLFQKGENLVIQ